MTGDEGLLRGRRVVFLSWRDTRNPEGGGAERALEEVARGLVARGAEVTIFCAAHAGAAPEETVDGIRFVRRGSKLTVYPQGWPRCCAACWVAPTSSWTCRTACRSSPGW
ncbi:MAG: glycosyltransferase family 4 protein [Nocardioides sp.]